jgi:hypothetical protein
MTTISTLIKPVANEISVSSIVFTPFWSFQVPQALIMPV